jgi:adenylyltransferase/sulfurtransferase
VLLENINYCKNHYFDRQDKVIGSNNSKKLTNSKVLVIGCGGLGTPIIEYLFRAGVNICVIDFDKVDVSNIHRQLFYERNIGELKSESIYNRLNNLTNLHNSKIEYKTIKIDNSFLDDEKNILILMSLN